MIQSEARITRRLGSLASPPLSLECAGRAITQTASDSPTTAMEYDAAGNLLARIIDPGGLALTSKFEPDSLGRRSRATQPDSTRSDTLYTAFGQMTKTITCDGGGTAVAASLNGYDCNLGRTTKTCRYHDPGNNVTATTADDPASEYVYTDAGEWTKTIDPNGNCIVKNRQYDNYGWLPHVSREQMSQ